MAEYATKDCPETADQMHEHHSTAEYRRGVEISDAGGVGPNVTKSGVVPRIGTYTYSMAPLAPEEEDIDEIQVVDPNSGEWKYIIEDIANIIEATTSSNTSSDSPENSNAVVHGDNQPLLRRKPNNKHSGIQE